jgi:hypothetical protein
MLRTRTLWLRSPNNWPDRNDAAFLDLYCKRHSCNHILALCFTSADETSHHWSVYGAKSAGVRITFIRSMIESAVKKLTGAVMKDVDYRKIDELKQRGMEASELPFCKRWPFRDEAETRIVFASGNNGQTDVGVPFPLEAVHRITLSPDLHRSVCEHVVSTIRTIEGCDRLSVSRSTLLDNDQWRRIGASAV